MYKHKNKRKKTEYLHKMKKNFFQFISPRIVFVKIYAKYVKINLKQKVQQEFIVMNAVGNLQELIMKQGNTKKQY